jgi:predicted DNA-binding antitoxin AbrB/MazE fold protein
MRSLLALLLITTLGPPQSALATTQEVTLSAGTEVEIELLQDVSSETMKAGQIIPFRLVRPIEINGQIVLVAGTSATGTVETVRTARKWGKNGAFDLRLQPLKLADGTLVDIDFYRPQRTSEKAKKTSVKAAKAGKDIAEGTVAAVYMTYFYFPLIPVALIAGARKGKPFNIRSGERYLVYITSTDVAPAPTVTEAPVH